MERQRPVIGRLYKPSYFERRRSDGIYEALNAPMTFDEAALQEALLLEAQRYESWHERGIFRAYTLTVLGAVVCAVVYIGLEILHAVG
jgi:hypothetical protein